jgi:hypothetical protein
MLHWMCWIQARISHSHFARIGRSMVSAEANHTQTCRTQGGYYTMVPTRLFTRYARPVLSKQHARVS